MNVWNKPNSKVADVVSRDITHFCQVTYEQTRQQPFTKRNTVHIDVPNYDSEEFRTKLYKAMLNGI